MTHEAVETPHLCYLAQFLFPTMYMFTYDAVHKFKKEQLCSAARSIEAVPPAA